MFYGVDLINSNPKRYDVEIFNVKELFYKGLKFKKKKNFS